MVRESCNYCALIMRGADSPEETTDKLLQSNRKFLAKAEKYLTKAEKFSEKFDVFGFMLSMLKPLFDVNPCLQVEH